MRAWSGRGSPRLTPRGAAAKSRTLSEEYRKIAQERVCSFLDAAETVRSSDVDGIHLDVDQLPLLAKAVHNRIIDIKY